MNVLKAFDMKRLLMKPVSRFRELMAGNADAAPWPTTGFCPFLPTAGENHRYRRFILLSHARSGTNMLNSALEGHPGILMYGEALHPNKIFLKVGMPEWDTDEAWKAWRNAYPVPFVRDVIYRGCDEETAAVGFKIFPEHLDRQPGMEVLWDWLAGEKDIAVISLHRTDLLSYFLSLEVARRAGKWLLDPGATRPSEAISIDAERAEEAFERRVRYRTQIRERFAHHPFMELTYEDLTRDTGAALTRVQSFLGVEPLALAPATLKQEIRPLREAISNYDELARRWRGTRWESVLTG